MPADGGPAATGVFFARNTEKFVFGGDQEELTTDAGYANYFGKVQASADGKTLTMATDPRYPVWCNNPNHTDCRYLDSNRTGAAVYVLSGKGAGQMRVVTGGGTAFNRSWRIDRAFGGAGGGVPIDRSSVVTFFERRSHMIIRENTFMDGGPCQIFGGLYHGVIAENTAVRSDGFIVEGLENTRGPMLAGSGSDARLGTSDRGPDPLLYPTYIPTYFIEVLDNRVLEGNVYGGGTGGFSVRGMYNGTSPFSGAMAAAIVLRNNSGDNSHFIVSNAVSDIIIEANTLVSSDEPGLQLTNASGTGPTRVFIGENNKGLGSAVRTPLVKVEL